MDRYCRECCVVLPGVEHTGEVSSDFVGLCPPGEYVTVFCDGCGVTLLVNSAGETSWRPTPPCLTKKAV